MTVGLPEFSGGSCQNERCPGSSKSRILSVEEAERIYPVKDEYDWWPLPPQATHVCTVCGFVYNGIDEEFADRARYSEVEELPIEQWEWDHDAQFDMTVREAVESFILGAPQEADDDMIARGVDRYVAGADGEFARDVMMTLDEYDGSGRSLAEYM